MHFAGYAEDIIKLTLHSALNGECKAQTEALHREKPAPPTLTDSLRKALGQQDCSKEEAVAHHQARMLLDDEAD